MIFPHEIVVCILEKLLQVLYAELHRANGELMRARLQLKVSSLGRTVQARTWSKIDFDVSVLRVQVGYDTNKL